MHLNMNLTYHHKLLTTTFQCCILFSNMNECLALGVLIPNFFEMQAATQDATQTATPDARQPAVMEVVTQIVMAVVREAVTDLAMGKQACSCHVRAVATCAIAISCNVSNLQSHFKNRIL